MIEEVLQRIASTLEEANEINKKGWEQNVRMGERYIEIYTKQIEGRERTQETSSLSETEQQSELEVVAKEITQLNGICICSRDDITGLKFVSCCQTIFIGIIVLAIYSLFTSTH